jgi:hypothetical protein
MENEKKNKVWIDEQEIVHMKIIRLVGEEDLSDLIGDLREILRGFSDKPKILVDVENIEDRALISSSLFRKKAVMQAKDFIQNTGFKKVAVFGTGIEDRTVASFVISAIRIKNIKIFITKEEALKWLREP